MAFATSWNNDMVFELIDMVRERPVLWDTSLEDHKDRTKKQAAWHDIADHFGLEKALVEKKMRMMIGQYRREVARMAAGAETSKWFAFHRLAFLSGQVHSCGASAPLLTTDSGEDRTHILPLFDEEECSEDSLSCQKTLTFPALVEPRVKRSRLEAKRTDTTSAGAVVKMLFEERSARDEYVVYGEYVANKLRHIRSFHARNTVQFHINNILYKAETGHFDISKPSTSTNTNSTERTRTTAEESARVEANRASPKWDSESVTSLTESMHSLEDSSRIESVQIKLENEGPL